MKKVLAALLISSVGAGMSLTPLAHGEVVNAGNNITTNDQVPSVISNYWTSWRQVTTTAPIQVSLIHYANDSSAKNIVDQTKTIPANSTIYIKGSSPITKDSTFTVVTSKGDSIYGTKTIRATQQHWITDFSSMHSLTLTGDNQQIQKMNVKVAATDRFTNHWQSGFLTSGHFGYGDNRAILAPNYRTALRARKLLTKWNYFDNRDEGNTRAGKRAFKQMQKYYHKHYLKFNLKLASQSLKVRTFKHHFLQVKWNGKIRYAESASFLPYNTTIDGMNQISSTAIPTKDGLKTVVIPNGTSLYTTAGEKWTANQLAKNGQLNKLSVHQYSYDGNQWKWHGKSIH